MISKRLYIFDLDGTLANAYRAIEKSLNFTLKKLGCPAVSYEKAKREVGRGDKVFMKTFFSKKDFKRALAIYRAHHKKAVLTYSKLRPHAKQLLCTLKRRKKITAIASNRPSYFTNLILEALGIKKFFNMVLCADEIKSNKPNPKILNTIIKKSSLNKQDAVFIGDMDIDLETARRADVDFVFVRGGSSALSSVKKYRNKKVVSSLREVLDLYE
ncbi:MAG: HAD family hydrolase [Candidatus Omnitrophota bacterium]|nr:HAD family hydrolase [Candidatus Omnitrophota bacterium]